MVRALIFLVCLGARAIRAVLLTRADLLMENPALLRCACQCLTRFAENDPELAGELGATAVLLTHIRRAPQLTHSDCVPL